MTVLGVGGCATYEAPPTWTCGHNGVFVDAAFDGGELAGCSVTDAGLFVLTITPEDPPPINPSPWYAFRVSGPTDATATVEIRFVDGPARYWPKISTDKRSWTRMAESAVAVDENASTFSMTVPASPAGVYVAGQEIHDDAWWSEWRDELSANPLLATHVVGQSRDGRPIVVFDTGSNAAEVIVLLGRQHPPEITGTLAMRVFLDAVLADTDQAVALRERYRLVIAPWINPDGVEAGHWRHNHGGVDLNRDWGPFTQPETTAVHDYLLATFAKGVRPALMLDFHSTRRDVFYTQLPEDSAEQPDFATAWLTLTQSRLPDYVVERDARPTSEQPNSKNFFFTTYGIPAITYELGDETDRATIDRVTPVFAESMMEIMLGRD